MRYYNFVLKTTSEKIKAGATIRLKDYDFESAIAAMNTYMYKNIKNGITFFAYREEGNAILAAFSYDEKKGTFHEAYNHILENLSSIFSVKQIRSEPCEITMAQFYENLLEVRRRSLFSGWGRIADGAHLEFYENYFRHECEFQKYDLSEKIVSENCKKDCPMYDESVINELSNIESHENTSGFKGNPVHYFISSKSVQAANDIAEALMQRLIKANRLSGRRMEIISEIDPYAFVTITDISDAFGRSKKLANYLPEQKRVSRITSSLGKLTVLKRRGHSSAVLPVDPADLPNITVDPPMPNEAKGPEIKPEIIQKNKKD